jgi:hypothetical protein
MSEGSGGGHLVRYFGAFAIVGLTAAAFDLAPEQGIALELVPPSSSVPAAASGPTGEAENAAAMSVAAIAALLVQESRNAYYAKGRPCACPEDRMTNGRRCGGNSAYSRAGGAAPYCYISDVPLTAIRKRQEMILAERRR